jgi:16S rRNA processing protein RimM
MALVGRIARAHGNRGQVIVNPETDFPAERFHSGAELFILRDGSIVRVTLTSVRFQGERPVVGVAGIDTMDAAEGLAGLEMRVPLDWLVPLPAGTFYRHELVGCRIVTRQGHEVGVVGDVEGTLGGSRLVVESAAGEVLIPLAAEICTTIDVAARCIVVDPPDGLLEESSRTSRRPRGSRRESRRLQSHEGD